MMRHGAMGCGCGRMHTNWMAGMMCEHHAGGMMMRFMAMLELDDGQRKRMHEILYDALRESIPKKAEIALEMLTLKHYSRAENPALADIEKTLAMLSQKQLDLHKLWARHLLEMRAILTPEQRRRIGEFGWHGMGMGQQGWRGGHGWRGRMHGHEAHGE